MSPPRTRPFSRAQALQNAAFLAELRVTGNARAAARAIGAHRATLTRRRARHPAFAAEWDAALAVAHAALRDAEGQRSAPPQRTNRRGAPEPRVIRTAGGRLQLRRAVPGRITRVDEQAFLAALSATANVRLSAAAAGFSHSAAYARRRTDPGFAREMRLALQMGYERLELALLEGYGPASANDDAWRHNDPPPIPPMTAHQALQLMYLHHKEARLWAEAPYMRTRAHETRDQWSARVGARYRALLARGCEDATIAAALRTEPLLAEPSRHEPPAPLLPALDQVTGWSKADPAKTPHDPDVALFGGWRLKDWKG